MRQDQSCPGSAQSYNIGLGTTLRHAETISNDAGPLEVLRIHMQSAC